MSEKNNTRLLAAAFFLPFFLLLGIYALLGIAPFGDRVLLIADARGQYLSYFALYQNLLPVGQTGCTALKSCWAAH